MLQLVVVHLLTSNIFVGKSSVSNSYSVQFDLILPTTNICTFPFFNVWFNLVQLTSAVFPFPLPFGDPSPPDGSSLVCLLPVLLLHFLCVQGLYIVRAVFPDFKALLVCRTSDLVLGNFLLFSLASIELNKSVYVTHLMSSLSFIFFIAVILAV